MPNGHTSWSRNRWNSVVHPLTNMMTCTLMILGPETPIGRSIVVHVRKEKNLMSHSPDPEERNHPSQGPVAAIDRFLAVMQGTADLFWILTPAGEMQEIGPSWQSFTGQRESDYLERGWLDAVYPADQPQLEETLHQSTL